jgi:hypothetical protein
MTLRLTSSGAEVLKYHSEMPRSDASDPRNPKYVHPPGHQSHQSLPSLEQVAVLVAPPPDTLG